MGVSGSRRAAYDSPLPPFHEFLGVLDVRTMTEVAAALGPDGLPPHSDRQILVLDLSKSMLAPLPDASGAGRQKIEIARAAVVRIVQNTAKAGTPFGLVTFTDTPRVVVPLGEIRPENLPYVQSIVDMLTPTGRSAIWDALATGADLLKDQSGVVHGTIVLVTDGWDNCSTRFEPLGAERTPVRSPERTSSATSFRPAPTSTSA